MKLKALILSLICVMAMTFAYMPEVAEARGNVNLKNKSSQSVIMTMRDLKGNVIPAANTGASAGGSTFIPNLPYDQVYVAVYSRHQNMRLKSYWTFSKTIHRWKHGNTDGVPYSLINVPNTLTIR